jgi:hypothetical protein
MHLRLLRAIQENTDCITGLECAIEPQAHYIVIGAPFVGSYFRTSRMLCRPVFLKHIFPEHGKKMIRIKREYDDARNAQIPWIYKNRLAPSRAWDKPMGCGQQLSTTTPGTSSAASHIAFSQLSFGFPRRCRERSN